MLFTFFFPFYYPACSNVSIADLIHTKAKFCSFGMVCLIMIASL
jgi:hypothetical protein